MALFQRQHSDWRHDLETEGFGKRRVESERRGKNSAFAEGI